MNIARIEFTAEDLPDEALAVASVRDGVLLFVWNRDAVLPALQSQGLDAILGVANQMVAEALTCNTPWHVALRSVG